MYTNQRAMLHHQKPYYLFTFSASSAVSSGPPFEKESNSHSHGECQKALQEDEWRELSYATISSSTALCFTLPG